MAEEKKDTELNEEKSEAGTEKKDENQPEKKYTDDDVNSISKKNSEKAVKKMLKELGITDTEKAKQILAKAAKEEKPDETTGTTAEDAEKLSVREYRKLLRGINGDTSLGYVVGIRSEKDGKKIKEMTNQEKKIRSDWFTFKAKSNNKPQRVTLSVEQLQQALKNLAGG